jgi:hypothetical protein
MKQPGNEQVVPRIQHGNHPIPDLPSVKVIRGGVRKERDLMHLRVFHDIFLGNVQEWTEKGDTVLNDERVHTGEIVILVTISNVL